MENWFSRSSGPGESAVRRDGISKVLFAACHGSHVATCDGDRGLNQSSFWCRGGGEGCSSQDDPGGYTRRSRGGQSRTRSLQGVHAAGLAVVGLVGAGGGSHVVTFSKLSGLQLQMVYGASAVGRRAGSLR